MAKVVITFEDTERETVTVGIEFIPAIENRDDAVCTPAQQSAMELWALANKKKMGLDTIDDDFEDDDDDDWDEEDYGDEDDDDFDDE